MDCFSAGFLEQIEVYKTGDEIPQIKVYYNPSEEYSQAAYEGVAGGCLEVYRQALLSERVGDMQSLTVFTVNSDNPDMVIQDEQKAGGKALGMMLPGMPAGWIQEHLGYTNFFIWVCVCTIPGILLHG